MVGGVLLHQRDNQAKCVRQDHRLREAERHRPRGMPASTNARQSSKSSDPACDGFERERTLIDMFYKKKPRYVLQISDKTPQQDAHARRPGYFNVLFSRSTYGRSARSQYYYYLRWKQTKTPRASNKTPLHYAVIAWCVLYCQSWVLFSSSSWPVFLLSNDYSSGKVLCCVHSLRTELAVVVSTVYLTDLRPLRGCHCNGTVRNRNW